MHWDKGLGNFSWINMSFGILLLKVKQSCLKIFLFLSSFIFMNRNIFWKNSTQKKTHLNCRILYWGTSTGKMISSMHLCVASLTYMLYNLILEHTYAFFLWCFYAIINLKIMNFYKRVCKISLFLSWLLHKNIKRKMRIYVANNTYTMDLTN